MIVLTLDFADICGILMDAHADRTGNFHQLAARIRFAHRVPLSKDKHKAGAGGSQAGKKGGKTAKRPFPPEYSR